MKKNPVVVLVTILFLVILLPVQGSSPLQQHTVEISPSADQAISIDDTIFMMGNETVETLIATTYDGSGNAVGFLNVTACRSLDTALVTVECTEDNPSTVLVHKKAPAGSTQIVVEYIELPPETVTVVLYPFDYTQVRIVDGDGSPVDTIRKGMAIYLQGFSPEEGTWWIIKGYWTIWMDYMSVPIVFECEEKTYITVGDSAFGWIAVDLGAAGSPSDTLIVVGRKDIPVLQERHDKLTIWSICGEKFPVSPAATAFTYTLFDLSGRVLATRSLNRKVQSFTADEEWMNNRAVAVLRGSFTDLRGKVLDRVNQKMVVVR